VQKKHQELVSKNSELADRLTRVGLSLSNETMSLPSDLAGNVAGLEKKVVLFEKQLRMAEQFLFPLLEFLATQQASTPLELMQNWNEGRISACCINTQDNTAATKKAAWVQALQTLLNAGKVVCCISDGVTVESISTQDAVDFLELLKFTDIKQLCELIKKGSDDKKWKEAHHKLNRWYFQLKDQQQVSACHPGPKREGKVKVTDYNPEKQILVVTEPGDAVVRYCDVPATIAEELQYAIPGPNLKISSDKYYATHVKDKYNLVYSIDSDLISSLSTYVEAESAAVVKTLLERWHSTLPFKSGCDKQSIERTEWLQALMQLVNDWEVYCVTQATYDKVLNSYPSILQIEDNLKEEGIQLLQQLVTTNLSQVPDGTDLYTQLNRLMFIPECEMQLGN